MKDKKILEAKIKEMESLGEKAMTGKLSLVQQQDQSQLESKMQE